MPDSLYVLSHLPMLCMVLLTIAAYVMGFFLLLYLLRIARWFVREHNVPRLFARRKKAERPPEAGGE